MILGRSAFLLPLTLVAACGGLAAGVQPVAALVGVMGLIVATVAVLNLTVAVAAFAVLAIAYFNSVPNQAFAGGLLVAVAWWIVTTSDRTGRRSLFAAQPGLSWLLVGFLAWMCLTVAWAHDSGVALQAVGRYALVLFFFPAVFAAVQTRREAVFLIGAMVLAGAGSVLVALASGVPSGERFGGPVDDPNTFAAFLVPAAILGAALSLRPVGLSAGWRVALRVAAAIALGGALASESRGAIVAMIVILVALPLVAGRGRRKALALSLTALALAGASVAIPGSPLAQAFQSRGLGTSGRDDLWTIAWRMIEAKPAGGVGVGNFREASVDYLLRPRVLDSSRYIVDTPLVAHNSFLQVAAEMGAVGVLMFVGIIAASGASAWRAARRFERAPDPGSEIVSRAVVLAMLAMVTALLFLSYTDYGRPLWIMLALGPALLAVSKSGAAALRRGSVSRP